MNKLHIAIGLFKMLSENNEIGTTMVAKEFEVSKRTAQRYLSEIAGLPFIQFDEERYMYSLIGKSGINGIILKSSELSFMNAVFGYTKSVLGSQNSDMIERISKKIFHANYTNSTHHMINIDSVDYDKIADVHMKLEVNISSGEEIRFKYTRYNRKYTVYPYKIVFHNGFWYLAAEHEGVLKKYLLEYIDEIKETGRPCPPIPQNIVDTLKNAKSIWFEDGDKTEVQIKVKGFGAEYFKRRPFLDGQKTVNEDKNGTLTLKFYAVNEYEMYQLLSPWMEYVEVVSPAEFRKHINKIGKLIASNNV